MDPAKERIALMRRIGVLFGQRSELWWITWLLAASPGRSGCGISQRMCTREIWPW